MKCCRVALAVMLATVALVSSLACAGVQRAAQQQKERNDLKQIALEYHNFIETNHNPPATLDEFVAFFEKTYGASPLTSDLKSGKYVIYLDVTITKLTDGSVNTVLGYETSVPASGGPVVMADSSVREMTAAEFAAAKKPPAPAKPSKP
jgi:hypothetical protein